MRETTAPELPQEAILANAPDRITDFFRVRGSRG